MERKSLRQAFSGMEKKPLFVVFLVGTLAVSLQLYFWNFGSRQYHTLYVAPQMISGFIDMPRAAQYPPLYPFLASIVLLLSNYDYNLINLIDAFAFWLLPLFVFLFTYLMFKDSRAAILSAVSCVFIVHATQSNLAPADDLSYAVTPMLFLAIFLMLAVYSFKRRTSKAYALVILWSILCGLFRYEEILFIEVFALGLILFENFRFEFRGAFSFIKTKLWLSILLFSIFFMPYFCFYQIHNNGKIISEATVADTLFALSAEGGTLLNLNYLRDGLKNFIFFWSNSFLIVFGFIALANFAILFKKYRKELLFLAISFGVLTFIYIIMRNGYQYRFAIYMFPAIAPMFGLAPSALEAILKSIKKTLKLHLSETTIKRSSDAAFVIFIIWMCLFYPRIISDISMKRSEPFAESWQVDLLKSFNCQFQKDALVVPEKWTKFKASLVFTCETYSLNEIIQKTPYYEQVIRSISSELGVTEGELFTLRSSKSTPEKERQLMELRDLSYEMAAKEIKKDIKNGKFSVQLLLESLSNKKTLYFLELKTNNVGYSTLPFQEQQSLIIENCRLKTVKENSFARVYKIESCY